MATAVAQARPGPTPQPAREGGPGASTELQVVLAFGGNARTLWAGAAIVQVTCYIMSVMFKKPVKLDISNTAFVPKFTVL